jgi:hypothetical protein
LKKSRSQREYKADLPIDIGDVAERFGWVNRAINDNDLDSFVDTLVRRLASFDHETLSAAKA